MDSLKKMIERMFMVVFFFAVPAILFILFNEDVTDRRVAAMADDFIMEVTKDGVLSREEYVVFADAVASFEDGYEVELEHQYYIENPLYEYTDTENIHNYFKRRNVLSKGYVPKEEVEIKPPATEGLKLQSQTNASVLASVSDGGYIPLPEDGIEPGNALYEPVFPEQVCYDGEQIVTIVRVTEGGLSYYLECDVVTVAGCGTATLQLSYNETPVPAFIDITAYPKTYECVNGHVTLLEGEYFEEFKATGTCSFCKYCAMIPEDITVTVSSLTADTGTSWESLALTFEVTYMDGHLETVMFNDEELYHDYDSNYCGEQTVTVSYKSLKKECFDITLYGGICVACGSRCNDRSEADYQRFNYCDTCLSVSPFYLGTTYILEDVTHHEDVMDVLDDTGKYYFNRGDYLKATVKRIRGGLPLPFLTKKRTIPIMADGFIRTKGHAQ